MNIHSLDCMYSIHVCDCSNMIDYSIIWHIYRTDVYVRTYEEIPEVQGVESTESMLYMMIHI